MTETTTHSLSEIRKFIRDNGYKFNRTLGRRATTFFNTQLYHVKGEWAGTLMHLEPWEHRIVKRIFAWVHADTNLRIIREAYIELPRKNGKSYLGSGLALYLLYADKEMGAEIVSAAAESEQAAIVFDTAKQMTLMNPTLMRLAKVYRRSMAVYKTASSYKVISAEAYTKHGKNLSGIVVDELHAQPDRELVDVLVTSVGSRAQPLIIYLTTAGYDRNSICFEKHHYARQLLDGLIQDFTFYPAIFAADPEDDWTDPKTWYKANPNLGISKKFEYMKRECEKAKLIPAYENTFKRLDLNIWTEQESRWITMKLWDACAMPFTEADLLERECFGGLDLASVEDLNAFALLFPEMTKREMPGGEVVPVLEVKVLPYFFLPEETLLKRKREGKQAWDVWQRDGHIIATPGVQTDYGTIKNLILEKRKKFFIREIAFDRWEASQLVSWLRGEGLEMVQTGLGYSSMNTPTKGLYSLMLGGNFHHPAHPVLSWNAANVAVEQDPAGNIKPSKLKSPEKIDGVVATILGLSRLLVHSQGESVYNEHGIERL